MKRREEMPVGCTWKMEDLYPSDQAWEAAWKDGEGRLPGYGRYKGHLGESAQMLYGCLEFDSQMTEALERLYVYGRQKLDENTANAKYQDFEARAKSLSDQAGTWSAFMVPEILGIEEGTLSRFQKEEPKLSRYQRYLEQIMKKKAYTLTGDMEELLALSREATQGPSQIFLMFNNADIRFPQVTGPDGEQVAITHGNYGVLMESENRQVRKDAFQGLYSAYSQFGNTLAAAFSSNIKQAVFYAKARHYSSSRAYYLGENEIPEQVYDNLLAAVHDFLPSLHQYVKVRKQAMGLGQIHMYDLYVPMISQVQEKIPYEKAKEMVKEGLAPLGEKYLSLLQTGFDNRWIDVYENEGKRSGAYSWGAYGTHPYVLLNYNDTLSNVFTLAHEMGHALHSWHSDQSQPFVNAGYKIFVAEVASTCNEALLIRHLLANTKDKAKKAYLLNHFLEKFRTTLFRQAMFAEFEAMAHREVEAGRTLTCQFLCQEYLGLNQKYFGPDMVVDEEISYEWARIPHFYTPFYVYQYATGFSAAVAISSRILSGDKAALDGYFQFLQGGCSMTPIDLLKLCGVDMSTAQPVKEALKVFQELLDEFQGMLSKGMA